MLRFERKRLFDVLLPTRESLARKAGNQIETYVIETRRTQFVKSFKRVSRGVRSAQLRQFRIIERLRAETRAIHAKLAKRTQLFAADRPGIHLQRDFRGAIDVELPIEGRENLIQLRRRE